MSVEPRQLIDIAKNVLRMMGVHDATNVKVTSASKKEFLWLVNFSYQKLGGFVTYDGCYKLDAQTEEIMGMWLNRQWK